MSGNLAAVLGGGSKINVRGGNLDGDVTILGTVSSLAVSGAVNGDVTVTNGDLQTFKSGGAVNGAIEAVWGSSKSVTVGGAFAGSYRTAMGIGRFSANRFSGVLSTDGDLGSLTVRNQMTGRARAGGNIKTATLGSMDNAMLAAGRDLSTLRISGDMTDSFAFAGFDPGDGGYGAVLGEDGNVQIDAHYAPGVPAQTDVPMGGSIKRVQIGGYMTDSTISAAVAPGADGYVGTTDDTTAGVGYIGLVRVNYAIYGTVNSCGIFAANGLPTVYHWRTRPFNRQGTAIVGEMRTTAGTLDIVDLRMGYNYMRVYFNHPVNSGTLGTVFTGMDPESITLIISADNVFDPLTDTVVSEVTPHVLSYSVADYSITLTLAGGWTWQTLGASYYQLTLDGSLITDIRNNQLDGEFTGTFPTGDGSPGGDFVYTGVLTDYPDTFDQAITSPMITLIVDDPGGTLYLGSSFETGSDVDIYRFTGSQYDFFSAEYNGSPLAQMGVFWRDDQGTAVDTTDDTFEVLARHERSGTLASTIFEAFELPEDGEYYVALAPLFGSGGYQLALTMASSDTALREDMPLQVLPAGEEIAYISNAIGDNNNLEGFNLPKQLVYLDFDGGTATKYYIPVAVDPFDMADIDPSLDGYEDTMINGDVGIGVTGIVENMITIFTNTPATHPLGALTVQEIDVGDPGDWAAYQAASEGLYFTTVDPATAQGLDPETDFTTVFIGNASDWIFGGGLLGIASGIDVANQSKADNALVFAQNFSFYVPYTTWYSTPARLNQLSRAFANTTAHELGHVLGLNHQPTTFTSDALLTPDDPNNDGDPSEANTGVGLMAYAPITDDINQVMELGTDDLSSGEFPVGQIDTADLLLRWLS